MSPANDSSRPDMSVVLAVVHSLKEYDATLRCLGAQTIRDRLELIVVAPVGKEIGPLPDGPGVFAGLQVVRTDTAQVATCARAAGTRAAAAPIVAFAEDHSYPEPDWAEKIVDAHRQPWAAVAPAVVNANPKSLLSWASIYIDFGAAVDPSPGGPAGHLPWHNSTYKRDILMGYDSDLELLLGNEGVLHAELRRKGYGLYQESRAKTRHLNISSFPAFAQSQYSGGRWYAATLALYFHWSPGRRLMRLLIAPLVPVVRLLRILRLIRVSGRQYLLPRVLPPLALGLVTHAAGEWVGYAFGAGDSARLKAEFEFDRPRFVHADDMGVTEALFEWEERA